MTAPTIINKAKKPRIAGKPRVMRGNLLPSTAFSGLVGFFPLANSVPHTKQRVESSAIRVPQVGHILVGVLGISDVIIIRKKI
jgi:hypothetical protein